MLWQSWQTVHILQVGLSGPHDSRDRVSACAEGLDSQRALPLRLIQLVGAQISSGQGLAAATTDAVIGAGFDGSRIIAEGNPAG